MEFDFAAERLARDQSKLKSKNHRSAGQISSKAKREAELQRKRAEQRAAEKLEQQRQLEFHEQYFRECERKLKVKSLASSGSLSLRATSIHGDGDKIALPPSVLERLTSASDDSLSTLGSPWTFRIGILNPYYSFPASSVLMVMKPASEEGRVDEDSDSESDADEDLPWTAAYLDELEYKYLAYTHGTVVEFTQEEGYVGLPAATASALLKAARTKSPSIIPIKRTVDPAGEVPRDLMDLEEEKTPGHLAWGLFDLPDMPIEVSFVQLPKGKACKLTPTAEAVGNGFYSLNDIKLVLEQSLVRTRATLSRGDIVHTWHRGKKYDLRVSRVEPSTYDAVVCVNADIEVDFGESSAPSSDDTARHESSDPLEALGGHRLLEETTPKAMLGDGAWPGRGIELRAEPPLSQVEGVCTIQIRADGAQGKRRFDVRLALLEDLFAFAQTVASKTGSFQLVTRFPRRVIACSSASESMRTLEEAGIHAGAESFLVESL